MSQDEQKCVLSAEIQQTVLDLFAPYVDEMTNEAKAEIERFDAAFSADHAAIGRVLRVHLVIEQYMNEHIKEAYKIENLEELRLTFLQKTKMLKGDYSAASFVKPGIQNINAVRNKFSHELNPKIEWGAINNVTDVLDIARKGVTYQEPIDAIEAFAPIACAFLINAPSSSRLHLEQLLKNGKIKFVTDAFM